MIRDIKKKMVILSRRMPFSSDVKSFMNHLEKKEWVYRNLRMEGSRLTPEQIENLLAGQYVLGASVWYRDWKNSFLACMTLYPAA